MARIGFSEHRTTMYSLFSLLLFILVLFFLSPAFCQADTVYEDGEDGAISGWGLYDDDPSGAIITNIFDAERQSRVIEFTGSVTANGYRLRNSDGSKWEDSVDFVIQWDMRYSESLISSERGFSVEGSSRKHREV